MAFPKDPSNGQIYEHNGKKYMFDETYNVWSATKVLENMEPRWVKGTDILDRIDKNSVNCVTWNYLIYDNIETFMTGTLRALWNPFTNQISFKELNSETLGSAVLKPNFSVVIKDNNIELVVDCEEKYAFKVERSNLMELDEIKLSFFSLEKVKNISAANIWGVVPGGKKPKSRYLFLECINMPALSSIVIDFSDLQLTEEKYNTLKILYRDELDGQWYSIDEYIVSRRTNGELGIFTMNRFF